ncbi:PolC-type DNA polymerase III [Acetonema longum]|uniref:DNA polymerase III PolC-type n=1 Tax=Acetonema longum DSM 6540 TaxID=1009370 RepID=F7NL87_9FIRM|nr:PolC-type DNA polymerase III [Acetonema longum]EGO63192.1 DNA polymerase iii, alpha subunit, gram-positive type [Acetonema longum DSM 6540]
MSKYCIAPGNCQNFLRLIQKQHWPDQHKRILQQCRISLIDVYPEEKKWQLHLKAPQALSPELLRELSGKLCVDCGLANVEISVQVNNLEPFLTQHWAEFVTQVTEQHPGSRHFLLAASWTLENECLTIDTINPITAEMLLDKGLESGIEQYIAREFSRHCKVRIASQRPECGGEPEPDEMITDEYWQALTEAANAGDTKPGRSRSKSGKETDGSILLGRNIRDEAQAIVTIQEEARNVVVAGEVVTVDFRQLRSGRYLGIFDIVDASDGISAKIYFDSDEQYGKVADKLSPGMLIKVKGTVQFDKYAKENVLFADSIIQLKKTVRNDNSEIKRIELHAHTRMSPLDSVMAVKDYIKTAARWKHPAVAITDHGVVQAFPEAYDEAAKHGVKIIYGMEGYLFDQDIAQSNHIVLLAKNRQGLMNLYKLVSISHLKYLHRTPRIPRSVLSEHREGLILGSACEAGELIQAMLAGADDEVIRQIAVFYDYLEIQPEGNNAFLLRTGKVENEAALRDINQKICDLGEQLNLPVVATCDVHFLNPEDECYRRILMSGQGYTDAELQPPLYFRTTEEMLAEFQYLGEKKAYEVVVTNTRRISDLVENFKPIPDELYSPQIPGAEDAIRTMSYARAKELYGDPLPELIASRLKNELDSIINNGFAVLYFIAHKLVKKSMDDGYLVGSRGSVGSSFVATMTGITEVNPLPPHWRCPACKYSEFITDGTYGGGFDLPDKTCPRCGALAEKNGHDIPFAVFMGFHGDKVPDIDLNFSGDYQPTAHKYTEELFGKDNVFRAGTIATIADKTAFGFVKNYYNDKGIVVRNALVNKLVSGCTGVKRTTGQHPGGIMVVPRDMDVHHFTPIQYPADDKNSKTITTHFDYHSISSRLVKLDILGHDDPTVIKMLEDLTGVDAKRIPFDDSKTMALFSSTTTLDLTPEQLGSTVGTFGIPEFGTKFVRQMLETTSPKTFSELVRISGFSHGTDVWLNNAQDLIKNGTAKLSEAISARDDIMVYLIQRGVEPQIAFKVMESVRKGKGVKAEDCEKLRQKNVPEWYIESCQKIKYMFPKAHAVAYVMMAFRIAYFKVYYPQAFYASYFSVRADDFDANLILQGAQSLRNKLAEFEQKGNTLTAKEKSLQTIIEMALEMYLRGFNFQRVDLYRSDATKFLIAGSDLLPPIASLQGVGASAAWNITQVRQGRPFSSMEDLRNRARVSKTVIDILQEHGCLQGLPPTDQMLLFA